MRALKIFVAILACLFVIFHLVEIPAMLRAAPGPYAMSGWLGKLAAILIGTAIAIGLFRSAAKKLRQSRNPTHPRRRHSTGGGSHSETSDFSGGDGGGDGGGGGGGD